jgi:hypothetical protein
VAHLARAGVRHAGVDPIDHRLLLPHDHVNVYKRRNKVDTMTRLFNKNWMNSTACPNAIVKISGEELTPGRLREMFRNGAKTAILVDNDQVRRIWEGLLSSNNSNSLAVDNRARFWENHLLSIARNHVSGDTDVGDMLRFIPGSLAYIACKAIIFPSGQKMRVIPDHFWVGNQQATLPEDILRTTWDLMSDILKSMLPSSSVYPSYAVAIERLKYPGHSDLDQMYTLLADSGGAWTRLGHKLDAYKGTAVGPFDLKAIRDLYAWCCLMPGVGLLLRKLNSLLKDFSRKSVPEATRLIGTPHVDDLKVVTALASDRNVIKTEVYDGRHWVELPLSYDSLAIFPSRQASKQLGVAPTWHRVLQIERDDEPATLRQNVTLSLAIVAHPKSE